VRLSFYQKWVFRGANARESGNKLYQYGRRFKHCIVVLPYAIFMAEGFFIIKTRYTRARVNVVDLKYGVIN